MIRSSALVAFVGGGVGYANPLGDLKMLLPCLKSSPLSFAFAFLLGCGASIEPAKHSVREPGALSLAPVLEPPRNVDGVGTFNQTEHFWRCEREYDGRSIEIRLFTDVNSFDRLASYARSLIAQEQISLSVMRQDIESRLSGLKWKFDDFNVHPRFNIDEFYPETFTISMSDDKTDRIHLYVFLAHPASGTDNWILRYVDGKCYELEWIPDR